MQNFHQNFTLIVDPSFYIAEKASQIPTEHVTIRVKRDIFSLKKNIKLIIETEVKTDSDDAFYFLNKNKTENAVQYKDIFFEMPNGSILNDDLVKEEIIEFLSLLN